MKKAKLKRPKCEQCRPDVLPENVVAVEIYRRVGTADGVRLPDLESAIRIYDIDVTDRAELSDKVLMISSQVLKQQRAKREAERNA